MKKSVKKAVIGGLVGALALAIADIQYQKHNLKWAEKWWKRNTKIGKRR